MFDMKCARLHESKKPTYFMMGLKFFKPKIFQKLNWKLMSLPHQKLTAFVDGVFTIRQILKCVVLKTKLGIKKNYFIWEYEVKV